MEYSDIRSERLDLVPLSPECLRAVLKGDLAEAGRVLGSALPEVLLARTDFMAMRLVQLEAEPAFQPWSLRAMILRESGEMVGHIGCHTAPGAEYLQPYAPGGVEFGFTVFAPFRRQGYAREASRALMHWAHSVHGVTRFVVSIRPDNAASQGVAAKLGFVKIGAHIDEVDGPEDILEHRLCPDNAA